MRKEFVGESGSLVVIKKEKEIKPTYWTQRRYNPTQKNVFRILSESSVRKLILFYMCLRQMADFFQDKILGLIPTVPESTQTIPLFILPLLMFNPHL